VVPLYFRSIEDSLSRLTKISSRHLVLECQNGRSRAPRPKSKYADQQSIALSQWQVQQYREHQILQYEITDKHAQRRYRLHVDRDMFHTRINSRYYQHKTHEGLDWVSTICKLIAAALGTKSTDYAPVATSGWGLECARTDGTYAECGWNNDWRLEQAAQIKASMDTLGPSCSTEQGFLGFCRTIWVTLSPDHSTFSGIWSGVGFITYSLRKSSGK